MGPVPNQRFFDTGYVLNWIVISVGVPTVDGAGVREVGVDEGDTRVLHGRTRAEFRKQGVREKDPTKRDDRGGTVSPESGNSGGVSSRRSGGSGGVDGCVTEQLKEVSRETLPEQVHSQSRSPRP